MKRHHNYDGQRFATHSLAKTHEKGLANSKGCQAINSSSTPREGFWHRRRRFCQELSCHVQGACIKVPLSSCVATDPQTSPISRSAALESRPATAAAFTQSVPSRGPLLRVVLSVARPRGTAAQSSSALVGPPEEELLLHERYY